MTKFPFDQLAKIRAEKAAQDCGFDLLNNDDLGCITMRSSHCPIKIWLDIKGKDHFCISFSDSKIGKNIGQINNLLVDESTIDKVASVTINNLDMLYLILKRAFQLSRTLPSEPLNEFKKQTQNLPNSTEIERITIQRVGQNIFRERLLEYWDGRCAVTALDVSSMLRASHIKPWSECVSDAERLDVFNGLLLSPNLDLAFDQGLITFSKDGKIFYSDLLTDTAKNSLGFSSDLKAVGLIDRHLNYLDWHNKHIFKKF